MSGTMGEFAGLASDLEMYINDYRVADKLVGDLQQELNDAIDQRTQAEEMVRQQRDALFKAFPELQGASVVSDQALDLSPQPPVRPAEPEPVMGPMGPMVFREMDDDPFAGGEPL